MHTETQRLPVNPARLGSIAGLAAAGLLALCLWKAGDAGAQDPHGAHDAKLQAYGRHLAQECTGCHRIDGVDNGIPSIVGWKADMFIATVKFYQTGARTNPVMVSVANSLNEKQLEALATYFASLPKPAPQGKRPGK
jgi:cytochrome c553